MRERLTSLNQELNEQHGVELAIRIGVTTGDVLAGDPSQGQAFVTNFSGSAWNAFGQSGQQK